MKKHLLEESRLVRDGIDKSRHPFKTSYNYPWQTKLIEVEPYAESDSAGRIDFPPPKQKRQKRERERVCVSLIYLAEMSDL